MTRPAGTLNALEKAPATYRKPDFTGGGWTRPSVVLTFTRGADPTGVFLFLGRRAGEPGWKPKAAGSLCVTDRWTKTYPDGAAATLFIAKLPNGAYRLSGGIAPVSG